MEQDTSTIAMSEAAQAEESQKLPIQFELDETDEQLFEEFGVAYVAWEYNAAVN
jgi:hypothetical protein